MMKRFLSLYALTQTQLFCNAAFVTTTTSRLIVRSGSDNRDFFAESTWRSQRSTTASIGATPLASKNAGESESFFVSSDDEGSIVISDPSRLSTRTVLSIQRNSRLPVWPVWGGVLVWFFSRLFGGDAAKREDPNYDGTLIAKLEDQITGRVCPNLFEYSESSPFILLAHHTHSFANWDPIRWFQRALILPEGFPSHPHRGFITLTYFLQGGFVHRDSMGIRQIYGRNQRVGTRALRLDEDNKNRPHSQWLHTGAGILHEEMFDHSSEGADDSDESSSPMQLFFSIFQPPIRQELFQLWINLPASQKYTPPYSVLLGGNDAPVVVSESGIQTLILAGEYQGQKSAAPVSTDMKIYHVQVDAEGGEWSVDLPSNMETALLYLRQGSLVNTVDNVRLPAQCVVHFRAPSTVGRSNGWSHIVLKNNSSEPADFFFLAGEPLREPCMLQGSMVLTSAEEVNLAYADYQAGKFGRPWDHKLSDKDWRRHVAHCPSAYQ